MKKALIVVGATVVALILMAVGCIILVFPTMWLWNWLVPAIFGLGKISVWKALGINLLCSILFKSHTNANAFDDSLKTIQTKIDEIKVSLNEIVDND